MQLTRTVENCYLVGCIEQNLKSVFNFREAANVYLNTNFLHYLQQFAVINPEDWPAEFYQRELACKEQFQTDALRNICPSMAPLHISLNSQEHVRKHIIPFQQFYCFIFGKQLARKSLPWRVTLMRELL